MNDAERKRLRRAGMVSIVLWVDRLSAAEALAQAGYGHADADSREAVRAGRARASRRHDRGRPRRQCPARDKRQFVIRYDRVNSPPQ